MSGVRIRVYAFAVLALLLLAAPVLLTGQERPPENIFFTLKKAGNFKTLLRAIEAAGLIDTVKGSGPFTLFAPTDEAFARLPAAELEDLLRPENREKLRGVLIYHILPEKVMSAELAGLREARTLKRTRLKIEGDGGLVKVDGAAVVRRDVAASNGVIHSIDTLLTPK